MYDICLCCCSLPPPSDVMAPVPYHGHHSLAMLKRPSRIEQLQVDWKKLGTWVLLFRSAQLRYLGLYVRALRYCWVLFQGRSDHNPVGPVREAAGGDGHCLPHGWGHLHLHTTLFLWGQWNVHPPDISTTNTNMTALRTTAVQIAGILIFFSYIFIRCEIFVSYFLNVLSNSQVHNYELQPYRVSKLR